MGLSYWTIPYVSIHDTRLIYLYNVGFVCVLGSLCANVFLHRTYLDSDRLQGITEARIKTPRKWSPSTDDPFCKDNLCVKWDADEVGYAYTSDSIFVTTRIKDDLEKSTCDLESQNRFRELGNDNSTEDEGDEDEPLTTEDESIDSIDDASLEDEDMVLECAEYKRISKKYYYPFGVEDFYLKINAFAEAQEFCSQIKLASNSELFDESENKSRCPYVYGMRKIPGELVSFNGTVIKHFNKEEEISSSLKEVPISTFLEAAGVDTLGARLRDKGGVFMITVKFHLDYSKIGYFTGLFISPEKTSLPTKFTLRVSKLAKAGYKVREVVGHTKTQRRVRTYYGMHFKLMVAGKAKKFSWGKLLSEIVMKFGLFGVVSTILDLLWQIVFPMVGFPDYNDLVYKSVKFKDGSNEAKAKDNAEEISEVEEEKDNHLETIHNFELKE